MSQTKPLRLGIIGLAGYGGTYFKTLAERHDVEITALCDANPDALQNAAQKHGVGRTFSDYRELLQTGITDAVCVATPHFLHYPMVRDALNANQHVFCEKPLTISAAHSDELAALARAKNRVLTCHYNQRTRSHIAVLRELIQSGRLGDITHIRASWMARYTLFMFDTATSWRLSREKSGGGIFIGRGSHLIDAALYMLGFPVVVAINATMSGRLANGDVDDGAQATLRLENGVSVSVEASYLAHLPDPAERQEWRILGTRGGAEYRSDFPEGERLRAGACAFPDAAWTSFPLPAPPADTPVSLLDDFLNAIAHKRDPLVTGEQAALITRLLEAGYRSADTGREVRLA